MVINNSIGNNKAVKDLDKEIYMIDNCYGISQERIKLLE